jgi:hypothetical protein
MDSHSFSFEQIAASRALAQRSSLAAAALTAEHEDDGPVHDDEPEPITQRWVRPARAQLRATPSG